MMVSGYHTIDAHKVDAICFSTEIGTIKVVRQSRQPFNRSQGRILSMKNVSFINMADGTAEEYKFLGEQEALFIQGLPGRIMQSLKGLEQSFSGYQISRLEHSLQSATRAHNDERSTEYVVAALLHDIGDELAPHSHSEMSASILRPYVSEQIYWIVKYHGVFQMYYYAHHIGGDQNARDRYKDHVWYDDAVDFCELYDQNCFDPNYKTQSLEFFRPMVETVFGKEIHF